MNNKLIKEAFKEMKKELPKLGECLDENDLACFEEGTLDERERERIEKHLISCSTCCDYVVSLNKVVNFSEKERFPDIPRGQLRKVKALVKSRDRDARTRNIAIDLTGIVQSLREFFAFSWIAQPIPVAVRSGALALLVLLMVSTTFIYYQQEGEIGLHMEIIGKTSAIATRGTTGGETVEKIIKDGDTLYSDDYCRINFKTDQDAYAYVLYYDSSGNLHQLYPDLGTEIHQKVKGKTKYTIPAGENNWFQLDNRSGRETVFVLASDKPISDLKETFGAVQGKSAEEAFEVLKGKATVAKVLSFNHQ